MIFLKLLTKGILLILGSLLAAFAVFGFFIDNTSDKWYGIFFIVLLCLPMFYFGVKIKVKPKQPGVLKKKPVKETRYEVGVSTELNETAAKFRYSSLEIQGKIQQALETIDIIEKTKNLDTLISRYDFLLKIYDDLKTASLNRLYAGDFQKALDLYKQLYYDKIPTQNQIILVLKPLGMDIKSFYYISVYNCFVRNYDFQTQQIEDLKTEKGKQGRYNKLLENFNIVKKIIAPEILDNENAKFIYDKLSDIEVVLKSKII